MKQDLSDLPSISCRFLSHKFYLNPLRRFPYTKLR